jgi:hypothetical protein
VLAAGCGVRQVLAVSARATFNMGLSLDGWWPLDSATTPNAQGEVLRHQVPGWSASARVGVLTVW